MASKPTKQQVAQAKARAGGNNPIKVTNKGLKKLGGATANAAMIIGPGKFLKAGKIISKSVGSLSKASRVAKDKQIIARSPDLKDTPNMTIKQAKRMKQGTASLAKTTERIAKESSKKGSYGSTTVGDSNAFKIKMGLDKPYPGVEVKGMPGLNTPSLGGLTKGPENMTLSQLDRLSAIRERDKAKAYAAAYRQGKRETKDIKKSMQSTTTSTVKKVAVGTGIAGAGAAGGAYVASKARSNNNRSKK